MTPREELLAALDRLRQRIAMAPWWVDTKQNEIIFAWLTEEAGQHAHTGRYGEEEVSLWEMPYMTPEIVDMQPCIRMARLINER